MDLTPLLINSSQPDPRVREAADAQLAQFAQANTLGFVVALAQVVMDETKPTNARVLGALTLKNTLSSRDVARLKEMSGRWLSFDAGTRGNVKAALLQGLSSAQREVRRAAGQAVAAVALVEIPAGQWAECVPSLCGSISSGSNPAIREAALMTLGYICESIDPKAIGVQQTNLILNVLVKSMSGTEDNVGVRLAALNALLEAVEFIEGNMAVEAERSAILQVVCANTQLPAVEIRVAAMQVLVEIARMYYQYLPNYIQVLFNLTLKVIKSDEEPVAQQAIEFWATIAEIESDIQASQDEFGRSSLVDHFFVKGCLRFLVPILMETLCKQDEDPESEEWNAQKAAACCLRLVASLARDDIVPIVIPFVTANITNPNWRQREAAVMAFGCILDGPSDQCLAGTINQAMPLLVKHMSDPEQIVRDTTAWTIGSVCELHPHVAKEHRHTLFVSLVEHLSESPPVAALVCFALHYLAEAFEEDNDKPTSPLSKYFQGVVQKLMLCCDRADLDEANLRAAVYEALNSMVSSVAKDQLPLVVTLVPVFVARLDKTFEMDDKNAAADLQALLCGVLLAIVTRLESAVKDFSDELMRRLLRVFGTPVARVHEEALLAIGGVANALGPLFDRYASTPFLQEVLIKAIRTTEDPHVCGVAVSLVSSMAFALEVKLTPYCDAIMTALLQDLQNPDMDRDIKPSIISCIGDIALAIGGNFEKYLHAVVMILQQASQTRVLDPSDLDLVDYVDSLREAVFECYSGILQGLSASKAAHLFGQYAPHAVSFVEFLAEQSASDHDELRDNVLFAAVSFIGDLAACMGGPGKQMLARDPVRRFLGMASMSKNPKIAEAVEWTKQKLR